MLPSMENEQESKSRVIKPRTPVGLVVGVLVGSALMVAGFFYFITSSQTKFNDARMTGTIISKDFQSSPREEITVGDVGLQRRELAGDFTLTVRVPQRGGEPRDFTVWVSEELFRSVEIGDSFDVGPSYVPDVR